MVESVPEFSEDVPISLIKVSLCATVTFVGSAVYLSNDDLRIDQLSFKLVLALVVIIARTFKQSSALVVKSAVTLFKQFWPIYFMMVESPS